MARLCQGRHVSQRPPSVPSCGSQKQAGGGRRMSNWTRAAAVWAVLLVAPGSAPAQTYPARPITIVVPASPGGVTDMLGRVLAKRFTADWGQQTIVDRKSTRLNSSHVEISYA